MIGFAPPTGTISPAWGGSGRKYITGGEIRPESEAQKTFFGAAGVETILSPRAMRYNRDMHQAAFDRLLSDLPLGPVRYYSSVTSTNDLAARWARAGAPNLAIVAADEQTAGRGRLERRWYTPKGAALAFSLILRQLSSEHLQPYTALGALAVCDTLNEALSPMLPAQIKWPNDVIATRRKLAGVLAEAHWQGDKLEAVILGIGINIAPHAIPPPGKVDFPATCVETVVEAPVDRWGLLHATLTKLLFWLPQVGSPAFMQAWERSLGLRGERVFVKRENLPALEGTIAGLTPHGGLRLRSEDGEVLTLETGEIRLRPVDSASK